MQIDTQLTRINAETNNDGDAIPAEWARLLRTDNGMVVGRLTSTPKGEDGFILQLYRHGEFVEIKRFGAMTEAVVAEIHRLSGDRS